MKLSVDLSLLDKAVEKMQAKKIDFKIDIQLMEGKEIPLEDIKSNDAGLLYYEDRHVVLYIKDNTYNNIEEIKKDPDKGMKFHICDCRALKDMREDGRKNRYVVTKDLGGKFKIISNDKYGKKVEDIVKLYVCKYCLNYINYKNYKNCTKNQQNSLRNNFSLYEFFEIYSSCFHRYPDKEDYDASSVKYDKNWGNISKAYREKQNYTCEKCGVNLKSIKKLLHVHHRDGMKGNNNESNLIVLCSDCHKKEPNHEHMLLYYTDMVKITNARIKQKIIKNNTWDDIYKFSDTALYEVIGLLKENYPNNIPQLFYKVRNNKTDEFKYIDLVWIKNKVGISLHSDLIDKDNIKDWKIYSIFDILEQHNQNRRLNIL